MNYQEPTIPELSAANENSQIRIGAVTYLNARPLTFRLARLAPNAWIVFDLPSRLADGLASKRLDVALIPSIEYARNPDYRIVSDACIACDGPVRSVKLYSRVPVERIETLAMDEGSRTSAAMTRIVLKEQYDLEPQLLPLPIGTELSEMTADAAMLIGDRGMLPPDDTFEFVWDMGERWHKLTGGPFVFAMWIARDGVELHGLDEVLEAARDEGVKCLPEIARLGAPDVGIPESECLSYLNDHLDFRLGERQRQGLATFYELAARHGLAPAGLCRQNPFSRWACPARSGRLATSRAVQARRLNGILDKTLAGERLKPEEAVELLRSNDLAALGRAADAVTERLHPEEYRTYNIDRNINYTNICTGDCRFCAFSRNPGDPEGYVIGRDELFCKIGETVELGGDQILLQGGLNTELTIEWCERLLVDIRQRYPQINIHGFSPPEVDHMARLSGLPIRTVLERLKSAGLGSLPGGGAEILVDRVRQQISPKKISADLWLEVCRTWHELGGRGSATMMFGHVETLAERIEHLERLRRLQDSTGGFTAFIAWTFQPDCTGLSELRKVGAFEYLKTLAVCRLYLDNFANIQASWVTQGLTIGQTALRFGANDFGSLMIEENVVAAAGVSYRTTEPEIRRAIGEAGYTPRRRNVFYELVDTPPQ